VTVEVSHASPPAPRSYLRAATLLACVLVLSMGWLWWHGYFVSGHDVDATVTFTGSDQRGLLSLRVFAGGDKAYWPELQAGETVRTTLFTGGGDTALTVQFTTAQGGPMSWAGPNFAPGTGYRIALQIDANGSVTGRHCVLPCRLP
jgi:hypothetical protein